MEEEKVRQKILLDIRDQKKNIEELEIKSQELKTQELSKVSENL